MLVRGLGAGIQIRYHFEALSHAPVEAVFRVAFHKRLWFPVFDANMTVLKGVEFQIGKKTEKGVKIVSEKGFDEEQRIVDRAFGADVLSEGGVKRFPEIVHQTRHDFGLGTAWKQEGEYSKGRKCTRNFRGRFHSLLGSSLTNENRDQKLPFFRPTDTESVS